MVIRTLAILLTSICCYGQAYTLQDQAFLGALQSNAGTNLCGPVNTGLLRYWKIDEGSGVTLYDQVSGSFNASLVFATGGTVPAALVSNSGLIILGRNQNAVQCPTPYSYVNCGNDSAFYIIPSDFSLCAWICHTNTSYKQDEIVICGIFGNVTHFALGTKGITGTRYTGYVANVGSFTGPLVEPVGAWTFLVFTRSVGAGVSCFYVNGVLTTAEFNPGSGSQAQPCTVEIGSDTHDISGTQRNWDGYIAEVRIYKNNALSANDVRCLYTRTYGRVIP